MRALVLGLDGADHELVAELLEQGRLPALAGLAERGAYGPLRSTIPAVTPTAWSSFLTGLNPGEHGIFNFSSNPNRSQARVESAASRSGAPLWRALGAAGVRSAFVTVPFTYPVEPIDGILVSGYGGPQRPEITPAAASERILSAHPDLATSLHPMKERWWEDFPRYARRLIEHVEQIADVCALCMEMEPDLGLLVVDFMSTDFAGHLGYARLDADHPAHAQAGSGDELIQVYQAVDRVCGELIERARELYGEEPTAIIMSDHGMKPIHWTFHANRWLEQHGHLRYRRRSLQRLKRTRLDTLAEVDSRLARTTRWYARALDTLPLVPRTVEDRPFADVDYGHTRAYCFATGGQIFLGEATGARHDAAYADRLAAELAAIQHPETGEPLFEVLRGRDLYHGAHTAKAPDLLLIPRDERVHVESSRRPWPEAFDRHDHLDPESFYGYSGHHGVTGILAAAGPGIRPGEVPAGSHIAQLAATILQLHGLAAEGIEPPIEAILAGEGATVSVSPAASEANDAGIYSADEEAEILGRLRDLGYE
jgi:predicted AlkP superfamily phosphohydrolase/phosphomutase